MPEWLPEVPLLRGTAYKAKLPWDDRRVAREELERLGFGGAERGAAVATAQTLSQSEQA